jgi:ATP-dependent DNA helicase RecQ
MSIGAVFRQFEHLILTGKVRDVGGLLPPERQRQIKAVLEMLEIELDSMIRANIGEKCQEEEFKFIRALILSKICYYQS